MYAKSAREGIVSTILTSVLLSATVLLSVTWSQAAQSSDDATTMRHLGQYMMRVGQEQYERGSYDQAEKSFQMALEQKDYLDPVEQRKLQSLLEKAHAAVAEQKRTPETKPTAELRAKGIPAPAGAVGAMAASGTGGLSIAPASKPPEVTVAGDKSPGQNLNGIAGQYQKSVEAYFAGDLKTAKEGFTRVLQNKSLPAPMAQTVRGYLAEIDAKQGSGQPAAPANAPAQTLPAVGVTALANTPAVANPPADANAPAAAAVPATQGEADRIAELYTRSVELYSQGELAAARQGFVEVAKSGLFKGPEGRRPEDYIATIDRLLAAAQVPQPAPTAPAPVTPAPAPTTVTPATPTPAAPIPAPESNVTLPAAQPVSVQPAPEQGGSIEAINRRRNIVRSYTEVIVNEAVTQAQRLMGQGQFDAATDRVNDAQRMVNEAQFSLGDELYKQYTQRLNQTAERIGQARIERGKRLAEQQRKDAAQAQSDLRSQAETDRQNRINELMDRAKAYWKQQQYEAALGQLENLLAIDPLNDEALTLKQMVQDMVYLRKQIELDQTSAKQRTEMLMGAQEAGIPYADEITYPKNWREVIQRPTRKPEETFQLDPANAQVYRQLEMEVDLSQLTFTTPMNTAIDIIRKSVEPALNISVNWRDLQTNVAIEPTSAINMDGLSKVKLGTALDNLVKAISDPANPDYPVEYVVNKGVVTIATSTGLPTKKMEARVYDISDLVGQQANYAQMGQMMGMMGGGMMGGMMGGMGGMGGGMGGMGGGMMGGMGGMGGGMMGGMGGGMLGGMGGMGGGMMGGMGGMGGGMMGGMGGMGGGMMGGMGGMGGGMMGGMGGMGGGMMGGMGGMGGGMMGGMGGMGGGMMGGMGGMGGGMMGGMGGMGGGMMGGMMGGMGGGMMAYNLRDTIMQTISPNSWYDISTLTPPPEGQITLYPTQMPMKMTVVNTAEVHQQIDALLDQLRKSLGHEVSIEARFLVVSQNFLEDIGLDLDFSYRPGGKWGLISVDQDSITGAAPDTSTRVPGSMGGLADHPAASIGGGWGTALDELQVSALIHATQGRSDAKALSAPKVTVMSGEGASFTITDLVAYALPPTTTTTSAVGGVGAGVVGNSSYNNVSAVPIGSTLSITPTITKDKKYVLLNIVSQQIDLLRMRTLQVTQANTNAATAAASPTVTTPVTVPETETSNVATRVSVPDRGTLLLGGHKLTARVDKEVGVPILSKIPILGRLFSNRTTIEDEKILLILVKPTIILQEETEHEAIASMEEGVATPRP